MTGCTDCFKEQSTINEKLQTTIEHAQKMANRENKKIAVFVEGQGFSFALISGQLPACTVKVVVPVR
jgi:hypothetical protein